MLSAATKGDGAAAATDADESTDEPGDNPGRVA
jgi:hypothetical protein